MPDVFIPSNYVIDRSQWRCGGNGDNRHGSGATELWNVKGFKCCLGQVMEQMGIPEKALRQYNPSDVQHTTAHQCFLVKEHITEFGDDDPDDSETVWDSTVFARDCITINDNEDLTDTQRERALERRFEEAGLRIEFTGKYAEEV